jgi:hypothetical protein
MARTYSRDGSGRFSSGGGKGDIAKTTQQARAEKTAERRRNKEALSGGRLGGKKRRRVSRARTVGTKATTKAMQRSTQRAKARFS